MKLSSALFTTLLATAVAEDLLFLSDYTFKEYDEAIRLGYSIKLVNETEWSAMTTADFAKFKAIIVPDPDCVYAESLQIDFLEKSTDVWGPAVEGNIILIGTDPTLHFGLAQPLIDNAINFAAAGVDRTGAQKTGLYFALSCYYDTRAGPVPVELLRYFGDFTVRGNLACYNDAHIVARSPALGNLTDADLSGWSCSVHEAFASYPRNGTNGFQALAIANNITGEGSMEFGDGSHGVPYIISQGATPAKCGDGIWDPTFGAECDDGNTLNGDGCSLSCKCESGLPNGNGTCRPAPVPSNTTYILPPTSTPSSSSSSTSTSKSASSTLNSSLFSSTSTSSFGYGYPGGNPYSGGFGYGYPPRPITSSQATSLTVVTTTTSPTGGFGYGHGISTPTSLPPATSSPCNGDRGHGRHGGWWGWGGHD